MPGRPDPKGRRRLPALPVLAALAALPALAATVALAAVAPEAIPTEAAQTAAQTAAGCAVPVAMPPTPSPTPAPPTSTPTPVAYSDATPAATPVPPTPTPVPTPDPAALLRDDLEAVAAALAVCLSEGDAETVVALATERYLGQLFGGGGPLPSDAYLAVAPELDVVPVRIVSFGAARRAGVAAEAEVVSVVGNQLQRGRWRFVQAPILERDPGRTPWRVDAEAPLPATPPPGATPLDVTLQEYAIAVDPVVAGEDAVLRGVNLGAEDHEMLVLRFEDGLTTGDLLRATGPGLPEGIAYVGQATVPAGGEAEIVLTGLEPGTYTVVCLLPTAQGIPHLALGMAAAFEVEA